VIYPTQPQAWMNWTLVEPVFRSRNLTCQSTPRTAIYVNVGSCPPSRSFDL
jgi:hypothetical protein